jgi:peroxiredoxin
MGLRFHIWAGEDQGAFTPVDAIHPARMHFPPQFASVEDAFRYCRDMDASLAEKLHTLAEALRRLNPSYQEAVDRLIQRLNDHGVGKETPGPGDPLPPFVLPDDGNQLVSLDSLLVKGPIAVIFHRGHWCSYCRMSAQALASIEERFAAERGRIAVITPERQKFAARLKAEWNAKFTLLTDLDNGYALSLGLAVWVGGELQSLMAASGRDLARYQGNEAWIVPIPAAFVVRQDGRISARFLDPNYRKRMAVEDLLAALRNAS